MTKTRSQKKKTMATETTETNILGLILKLIFTISFIGLGILLFTTENLQIAASIMTIDLIIAVLYWLTQRKHIRTSITTQNNMRLILGFVVALITMTFYALALIRSDQFYDTMKVSLLVGGALVWYVITKSSRDFINSAD